MQKQWQNLTETEKALCWITATNSGVQDTFEEFCVAMQRSVYDTETFELVAIG